ncbi:PREDICTED: nuclear receptor 2C2-associated protein-like isoform X1 [Branchiostoma belcheri]|uniref:Nuclear receptor 2C2-associated protein-like isoform X1 n=1 Tax=Branchiostoma belcheri TaxID=7741 RepID=A0A6P4XTB1_BRABE|nr:PREDICTED: nuclear receptor 2C2-associated protein-like isoform X1 [Branchiostoma belcheri]
MAFSLTREDGPLPAPKVRVSSVLNRDVKQFGKKFMFDGDEETCWNSDQGSPQWILVEFSEEVCPQEIQLQFQGGFVGKDCRLEVSSGGGELARFMDFYPEDVNSLQRFTVKEAPSVKRLRIVFPSSTDFFGRVTVYKLEIMGTSI